MTVLVGLTLAIVIVAAGPRRAANGALAALILIKAVTVPPGAFGTLVDSYWPDYYASVGFASAGFMILVIYPIFLGVALETPLTAPFRRTWVRASLLGAALVLTAVSILRPQTVYRLPGTHTAAHGWTFPPGEWYTGIALGYLAVLLYALAATISAFRRTAPHTVARRRARGYLIAFSTQDVGVALALALLVFLPQEYDLINIINGVLNLTFAALVTTALLRYQLFDFDLKVKTGFARGIVAAIFLGTFVVAFAIAQQYVSRFGVLAGGIAVALLVLALNPIRRATKALADRVFPGVSHEEEYLVRKKVELYREAVAEALRGDGRVDAGRASSLHALRTSLGLSQRDHDVVVAAQTAASANRSGHRVVPGVTILGKYQVERELGAGGNARAFLATDVRMGRPVVLKTLLGGDQAAIMREARAAASVDHPNVVRVYDVETLGPEAVLVLEYVDGGSLKDRLAAGGPLSDRAFVRVADDVLRALEAVHAAGAVHRDVKPGNVLLTRDGRAKLSDFGIARVPGLEATIGGPATGTVQYMSPEQARGRRLTAASDLYSAAATLFEARTGRPVVEVLPEESLVEVQMRIGAGQPFRGAVSPPALQAWFGRALAPEGRFASAAEMRAAFHDAVRAPPALGGEDEEGPSDLDDVDGLEDATLAFGDRLPVH